MKRNAHGFTIVELLIVIVVIGILATISIVAYNGISDMANDSAVKSDIAQRYKKMKEYQVLNGLSSDAGLVGVFGHRNGVLDGEGRAIVSSLLGGDSVASGYHPGGDGPSLMITKLYPSHWFGGDGSLAIVAYSKSGKVFIHNGELTRAVEVNQERQYLEEELARFQQILTLGDSCASGSLCSDEALQALELEEWTELETSMWAEMRQDLLDYIAYIESDLAGAEGDRELSIMDLYNGCGYYSLMYFVTPDEWVVSGGPC